jgi:hypothetical protein
MTSRRFAFLLELPPMFALQRRLYAVIRAKDTGPQSVQSVPFRIPH